MFHIRLSVLTYCSIITCIYVYFALKGRHRNDLHCVRWNVKP